MGNDGQGGGRKLSVVRELVLLAASLEALRLAAHQKLDGARHAERVHDFALVMVGGLHVLRDRIHLVEQILVGVANPAAILCPANQAGSTEEGPGIVEEWSAEEEMRRLEAEWCRARYRRDVNVAGAARKKPDGSRSN